MDDRRTTSTSPTLQLSQTASPACLGPTTAEDILAGILRRDGAQTSATSTRRILDAPATQLRDAVLHYQEALGRAADHVLGQAQLAALDQVAEQLLTGLTTNPPTPPCAVVSRCGRSTARTRRVLRRSAELHELVTADDPAAVLDWRISHSPTQPGPLPPYPNGCATTATGAATSPIARVGCVISSRRSMLPPPIQQRGATPVGRGDSGRP